MGSSSGAWLHLETPPMNEGCRTCKHHRLIGVTAICQRTQQMAVSNDQCLPGLKQHEVKE